MSLHFFKSISPLILLYTSVNAQITLPTVTGCIGNPAGTATFTTDLSVETGTERIVAGDFWNQIGAVWIFSTDTEGIEFSQPGIPGYGAGFGGGGPPAAAESALKLDDSKTEWTLVVPASTLGGEWDIDFAASASTGSSAAVSPSSSAASSSAPPPSSSVTSAASPLPTSSAAAIAKRYLRANDELAPQTTSVGFLPRRLQKPMPVGAKFRRQAAAGQVHLIISATLPCLGPSASATVSGNPTIASECDNNDISTNAAAWTTYGVFPHPTLEEMKF